MYDYHRYGSPSVVRRNLQQIVREKQRLVSARGQEKQHEAVGFLSRHDPSQTNKPEVRQENSLLKPRNMLYSHCRRSGHEKRDCCQIIGFPEWWPDRNNNGGRGRGRGGRISGSGGSGRGRAQATAAHDTFAHAMSPNTPSVPGTNDSREVW